MAEYYYFVSSLPSLRFDEKPFMSLEGFVAECERHLTAPDLGALREALRGASTITSPSATIAAWGEFRHALRNALAQARALAAGQDPLRYVRPDSRFDAQALEIASEAVKAADPWSAQTLLDKRIWDVLEGLTAGHMFDGEFLVFYGLKLEILERREEMRSSRGREAFEALLQSERLGAVLAQAGI